MLKLHLILLGICFWLFSFFLYCTEKPYTDNPIIEEIIAQMTLEEKIGQMTQGAYKWFHEDIHVKEYYLGSVLSGGDGAPEPNHPEEWVKVYNYYQELALSTRLQIPMLYGFDAVHGASNLRGSTIFPHNIGLGCTRNPNLIKQAAQITAKEIDAIGVDWTFAPCVAVARDIRWGRTYESYGEHPQLVAEMTSAYVSGLQGETPYNHYNILACAKHYVGDGGTTNGIDQGNAVMSEEELRAIHFPGYLSAIEAGVGSVMVSYSRWNGLKMHQNEYLINQILKKELGFKGFVVTDWAGIEQVAFEPGVGSFENAYIIGVNAGIDLFMLPSKYDFFIETIFDAVLQGLVPMNRINDAVRRILTAKYKLGLFNHPYANNTNLDSIGCTEHRNVARECVRQSLVLLKNKNQILPLDKNINHIHMAGKTAHDMGNQCGGWTVSWMGSSGDTTPGTTIYEAVRNTVSQETSVTLSIDGTGAGDADVGVVVIGETPYCEGFGDDSDLSLDPEDLLAIQNLLNEDIPVVVILVSGRPLIITEELPKWDAFIAAWLPGTEGQGVADVLFGDYNPTGKLSVTWPKTIDQEPINFGDSDYDPLFEYGFGLSY